jgi:hypothetical protein
VLLLMLISLVYTLFLAVLTILGCPAVVPSVLPLAVEGRYPVQIWYQELLFFATAPRASGAVKHVQPGATALSARNWRARGGSSTSATGEMAIG